jgi:hypothetical protein
MKFKKKTSLVDAVTQLVIHITKLKICVVLDFRFKINWCCHFKKCSLKFACFSFDGLPKCVPNNYYASACKFFRQLVPTIR